MKVLLVLCAAALLSLMMAPASAQTTVSTIEGTIKDSQGSVVAGAQIVVKSAALGIERSATSDADGFYRVAALPPGNYSLTITHAGFATRTFDDVELTVNRTLTLDIPLEVGAVQGQVDVVGYAQLLNPTSSSTGATVTPQQIREMPTNGRNYLDLMQLVPGVVVNRQANVGSDNSTPVLGERAGNNNFLIDGQPNKDSVNGGAASQFNQETIAEFQVLTAGFRAEGARLHQVRRHIADIDRDQIHRNATHEWHPCSPNKGGTDMAQGTENPIRIAQAKGRQARCPR